MQADGTYPFARSPHALQKILRKVTETLASELVRSSAAAPDWSDREWTVARAVAAMHGVSSLLSSRITWVGPSNWAEFLTLQRNHTTQRHARIQELVCRLHERAGAAGVPMIPLKGVALHAMGVYQPGERPMADIDILVRPREVRQTQQVLQSLGFHEVSASWKERVYVPVEDRAPAAIGEHAQNSLKIELHERICEVLPWRLTDISERVFSANPRAGMNPYPSLAALMSHLLFHAAGAMAFQALRLLHLHDIALLAGRMSAADWDEVLKPTASGQTAWWAYAPLDMVSKYYPSCVPDTVMKKSERCCPTLLGRVVHRKYLSDVSLSYLRIDAFPGIEWSRSLREMVCYGASRIKPGATQIALRGTIAKNEAWAAAGSWQRTSQFRRVVRWLTTRPQRAASLYAVQAAFNQLS
jgi:Uncharacterised nucleotidyltransferase